MINMKLELRNFNTPHPSAGELLPDLVRAVTAGEKRPTAICVYLRRLNLFTPSLR